MKHTKRVLTLTLAFSLLLISLASLSACGAKSDDTFNYTKNEYMGEEYYLAVVKDETLTEVVFPSEFDGLPVRSIGSNNKCTNVEKITLPASIQSIHSEAFQSFTKLKVVEIQFSEAKTSISKFLNIEGNDGITVIIDKDVTKLLNGICNVPTVKEVVFEEGCKCEVIETNAFAESGITEITLPASVKSLSDSAFSDSALEKITLSEGLVGIGAYAFKNTKLTTLSIPSSVTNIHAIAFSGCTRLSDIDFAGTKDEWKEALYGDLTDSELKIGIESEKNNFAKTGLILTVHCSDGDIQYSLKKEG